MDPLAPESRRPRPVAGLPAVDARAVAKAWLIELIAATSLEEAVELPSAELAREGPGLVNAVLAALSDDAALMRLRPGGNLAWLTARSNAFTGADRAGARRARRRGAAPRHAGRDPPRGAARRRHHRRARRPARARLRGGRRGRRARGGRARRAGAAAGPGARRRRRRPSTSTGWRPRADPRPEPVEPPAAPDANIVALRARHDRRAEAGSWEPVVERRLERHAHDGSPFALLAVEADGVERLTAADDGAEALLDALERALAAELRPADQLLREAPGRYWVTAPDTGPGGRAAARRAPRRRRQRRGLAPAARR